MPRVPHRLDILVSGSSMEYIEEGVRLLKQVFFVAKVSKPFEVKKKWDTEGPSQGVYCTCYIYEPSSLPEQLAAAMNDIKYLEEEIAELFSQNTKLRTENEELKAKLAGLPKPRPFDVVLGGNTQNS